MAGKKSPSPQQDSNESLLQTQRMLAWSAYQESLKEFDNLILGQFHQTIRNLRRALWVNIVTYLAQFLILSIILFYALIRALLTASGEVWPWAIAIFSLSLLGVLLFRNPIRAVNRSLIDLTRIQIILQGYNHQLYQVDATFKLALLSETMDLGKLNKYLGNIQIVMDGNIESLIQFLDEMHS
jgi:hypothetical protein